MSQRTVSLPKQGAVAFMTALLLTLLAGMIHFAYSYWSESHAFIEESSHLKPIATVLRAESESEFETALAKAVLNGEPLGDENLAPGTSWVNGYGAIRWRDQRVRSLSLAIASSGSDLDEWHGHAFVKLDLCHSPSDCSRVRSLAITLFSSESQSAAWKRLLISETARLEIFNFSAFAKSYQDRSRHVFVFPLRLDERTLEIRGQALLSFLANQIEEPSRLPWAGLSLNCSSWTRFLLLGAHQPSKSQQRTFWGRLPMDLIDELRRLDLI